MRTSVRRVRRRGNRWLAPAGDHCQGSGQGVVGSGSSSLQKPSNVIDGITRVLIRLRRIFPRALTSPVRFPMSRVGVVAGIEERKLFSCVMPALQFSSVVLFFGEKAAR